MSKKTVSVTMLMLLMASILTVAPGVQSVESAHTTITVPDDYPTIQEAIDHANEGDTVFVKNGTYYENVVIDKTLSIVGEGKESTIIDGSGTGSVVQINASDTVFRGFTVQNSGKNWGNWDGGILVRSNNSQVFNNVLSHNRVGIISLSSGNLIANNTANSNDEEGISLNFGGRNLVLNNAVSNSSINSIDLFNTGRNTIVNNNVSGGESCISIQSSGNNEIVGNVVSNASRYGIIWYSSYNNTILGNTISKCYYGVTVVSYNNSFYHNNIIDSLNQSVYSYQPFDNVWDGGYPCGGNYWSDYTGVDLHKGQYQNVTGSDGIGDTSYAIDVKNKDRYPLMKPWKPVTITGDLNHDGTVNILDIVLVSSMYKCEEGDPRWNPEADVAPPYGVINLLDLVTIAFHYGEKYP